jgi:hypothetical protein
MSRLTQLAEMRALREDVEQLKAMATNFNARIAAMEKATAAIYARIEALEAKRGPGRPKKDE